MNGNGYQTVTDAPEQAVSSGEETKGNNGNGRITSRQLGFIMKLINENNTTRKELNEQCINIYGTAVDFLSKADASALIKELNH